jgi:N6-adenosine-specific RNA methylase IME4
MNAWEGLTPPYACIVADPPWHYEARPLNARTPGKWSVRADKPMPFSTMQLEEIASLPVHALTGEDCRMFLWTTNRYLPEAFDVLAGWGFTYRQTLVWHKTGDVSPYGPPLARQTAEFLLVGSVGLAPIEERWPGAVIAHPRMRRHSEKPALFADLIERSTPGPYVELFARAPRLGWDSWGYGYESAAGVS